MAATLTGTSDTNGTTAPIAPTTAAAPTNAAPTTAPLDPAATAQAKYAKEVNSYVSEYIRFADLKAGAALTLTAAVGGALGSAIPKILGAANPATSTKIVFAVLFIVAAGAAAMAILFATLSLIPRVPPTNSRSLNSFPDIAQLDPDDYVAQIGALTERDITKNLAVHNVTLSRVAQKKFDAIKIATYSLMTLLFAGFVIVLFYVLAST